MKHLFLTTLGFCLILHSVYAAPAHKHGSAELTLVQEGKQIEVRLQTPLVNLIGTESADLSEQQRTNMHKAIKRLKDFPKGVLLEGINCQLEHVHSHVPSAQTHEAHHHHDEHHTDEHLDIEIEYKLTCNSDKQPNAIVINWFDNFPLLEQLEVIWLLEKSGSQLLTPDTSRIDF